MSSASLADLWHQAPRRWGHQLHSLCSYMAMFPPSIPHVMIRWLTEPGDVVYDPFSERGTTPLEARLLGRVGLGSDLNPLAWLLTAAKVDPPSREDLNRRLAELDETAEVWAVDEVPEHVRILFHPETLGELLWLRSTLSLENRTDRFLMAVLLGILHLNAGSNGVPRGLTVSMPNTFAMGPGYVSRYISDHGLRAPRKRVCAALRDRLSRCELPEGRLPHGSAWLHDVTRPLTWPEGTAQAKLVFTSPPYLQVIKYGKFNWIRLWLLGHEPRAVDEALFASSSLERYLQFLTQALVHIRPQLREDGLVCLVIGDVRRGERELNLADGLADRIPTRTDLRVLDILVDRIPTEHKVSRIWKGNRGRATKTDRILLMGGPKACTPSPPAPLNWAAN